MANTVTAITTSITGEVLWGEVGKVIPMAVIVTLFSLGFYLVRRQLKKVSKAKGGM